MADENKLEQAQQMYKKICSALDAKGWRYNTEEENQIINFSVRGDDLSMEFFIKVHAENQFVYLASTLPFVIAEDKRVELALAVNAVNTTLVAGCFDFSLQNGRITFRISQSYMESDISEEALGRLVTAATAIIDDYNEKFMGLGVGMMELDRFLEQVDNR